MAIALAATRFSGVDSVRSSQSEASEKPLVGNALARPKLVASRPLNRIVVLRGVGLFELAAILGDDLGEQLVGWDSSLKTYDKDAYSQLTQRYPHLTEVPVLDDALRDASSAEAVVALNPDLVVISSDLQERDLDGVGVMERAGLPLFHLRSDDRFRDPQRSIRLLGQVLGRAERASEVGAWLDAELDKVFSRLAILERPIPTIYIQCETQAPSRIGSPSGSNHERLAIDWGCLAPQLRCRVIAANGSDGTEEGSIGSPVPLNPDAILFAGASDPNTDNARALLHDFVGSAGWSELKAVQERHVYRLQSHFAGGVTSFAAAQQLAKWLYPNDFADLDPETKLREFHDRFMPIEYSGTWMVDLVEDR
jgi:iron complex transport system substrate-binding protein